MAQNDAVEFYVRFLTERATELRAAVDQLLQVLPEHDAKRKLEAAKQAAAALERLVSGLSAADRPAWSATLANALRKYVAQPIHQTAGHRLLKALIDTYGALQAQEWRINEAQDLGLDFESVYQHYARESRLEELFDEAIIKLTGLVESGEIDSVRVLRSLDVVIATLRRNRRASYFSTHGAWKFTSAAFENFLWEALSDIPGLGAVVRAVRTTFDEIDEEMQQLDHNMNAQIVSLATSQVPELAQGASARLPVAQSEPVAGEPDDALEA